MFRASQDAQGLLFLYNSIFPPKDICDTVPFTKEAFAAIQTTESEMLFFISNLIHKKYSLNWLPVVLFSLCEKSAEFKSRWFAMPQ